MDAVPEIDHHRHVCQVADVTAGLGEFAMRRADLISAFDHFYRAPRVAEVYNIGGGRDINCSMLEAIDLAEELSGKKLEWTYSDENRIGDHMWYVSDVRRFQNHYPDWKFTYDLEAIMGEIHDKMAERWLSEGNNA